MSVSDLYHYLKREPSFEPSGFTIVGGGSAPGKISKSLKTLNDLGEIQHKFYHKTSVIGDKSAKTASTVDPRLVEMFSNNTGLKTGSNEDKFVSDDASGYSPEISIDEDSEERYFGDSISDDEAAIGGGSAESDVGGSDTDSSNDSVEYFDVSDEGPDDISKFLI